MIKASFDEMVAKIKEKSGLEDAEIKEKIDKKVSQLSGLVSREGAAHIIANEFGIKLFEQVSGKLQIKNVLRGMSHVEILGKAASLYSAKTFKSSGREGKVGSILIADETGNIRIVLWNDQADNIEKIKQGDVVRIKGGYVRQRNNTNEVHLNERGRIIINPEGETVNVDVSNYAVQAQKKTERKQLSELTGTESNAEILATVVQVFEPRYFEVCSKCGKRAKMSEGNATCDVHGAVKPDYSYVLNAFIDDGTDSIRAVFFREQAQKLLNKNNDEVLQYKEAPDTFETARNEVLGASVKITGRVTKNEMFDRTEIIANSVILNPDPEPEIARIEEELKQLREEKK